MEKTTTTSPFKSNIIQFPTIKRRKEILEDREFEISNNSDDAINIAQYLIDIMQTALDDLDVEYEIDLDMMDPDDINHKDFKVILNLLVAMFYRRADMPHLLHDDLDSIHEKIMFFSKFRDDFEFSYDEMPYKTKEDIDELLNKIFISDEDED